MRRYPYLEVVLVVDGAPVDLSEEPRLHVHSAASMSAPYTSNLLDVRVVQFNRRVTVGEKRNAAVLARPHPIVPAGRTATPRLCSAHLSRQWPALLASQRDASNARAPHARAQAARGEILLHWDDDDLYDPSRIEAQIRPLLDGTADMSALTYSHAAAHAGGSSPTWYAVKRGGAAQAMHAQSARETRAHTHSARWLEIT